MKTIETKYLGPTWKLGARIKATALDGRSKTIPYPYELSPAGGRQLAVQELNKRLKWEGDIICGKTYRGWVFVFVNGSN
jgi:hypothetical protein